MLQIMKWTNGQSGTGSPTGASCCSRPLDIPPPAVIPITCAKLRKPESLCSDSARIVGTRATHTSLFRRYN